MKYFQEYETLRILRIKYKQIQPGTLWKHIEHPDIMCKIVSVNLRSKTIKYQFMHNDDITCTLSIETLIRYLNLVENPNVETVNEVL